MPIKYRFYEGTQKTLMIKIEGKSPIRLHNYITFDYDFNDTKRIKTITKTLIMWIRKNRKIRLFRRLSDKGIHFIMAFKKDTDNFYEKPILKSRKQLFDDNKRIQYDTLRTEHIHYLPYLPGVLFDCKDGNYRNEKWEEIDL